MPASFHTSQSDKDLVDAKMWARKGPGWLTNAKEQGRADDVGRIEGNIAWATAYLASHGVKLPTAASTMPAPAVRPGSTASASSAPRPRTAAEVRALQVDACTQVWRNGGRKAAASMGFPADVMDQVGKAMQAPIAAMWGETVAEVGRRYGV